MTSMSSVTAPLPAYVRGSLPPPVAPAIGAITARPVPAGAASAAASATREDATAAMRQKIEAAVRSAFLAGLVRGSETLAESLGDAAGPARDVFLEELLARLSVQSARLPVLPEPATPARDAFAEAVIAMRSGLRRAADGEMTGGA